MDFSLGSNAAVVANQWVMCGFAGDANGGSLYINGLPNTGTGFGGTGTNADDTGNALTIGEEEDATDPFDGDIEIVMVWDRILSADEVAQVYKITRDRFFERGMTLIDTITVTAGAGSTSLTFSDLNGTIDGTYYLTGRVSSASGIEVVMRPNATTSNLVSVFEQGTTTVFTSTSGLLVLAWSIPEGAAEGTGLCNVWLYPEDNKGGSTSTRAGRRMYTGVATLCTGTTPTSSTTETYTSGGFWNEASTNITSLEIVATVGTMEQGSSFSLYKIEDAG